MVIDSKFHMPNFDEKAFKDTIDRFKFTYEKLKAMRVQRKNKQQRNFNLFSTSSGDKSKQSKRKRKIAKESSSSSSVSKNIKFNNGKITSNSQQKSYHTNGTIRKLVPVNYESFSCPESASISGGKNQHSMMFPNTYESNIQLINDTSNAGMDSQFDYQPEVNNLLDEVVQTENLDCVEDMWDKIQNAFTEFQKEPNPNDPPTKKNLVDAPKSKVKLNSQSSYDWNKLEAVSDFNKKPPPPPPKPACSAYDSKNYKQYSNTYKSSACENVSQRCQEPIRGNAILSPWNDEFPDHFENNDDTSFSMEIGLPFTSKGNRDPSLNTPSAILSKTHAKRFYERLTQLIIPEERFYWFELPIMNKEEKLVGVPNTLYYKFSERQRTCERCAEKYYVNSVPDSINTCQSLIIPDHMDKDGNHWFGCVCDECNQILVSVKNKYHFSQTIFMVSSFQNTSNWLGYEGPFSMGIQRIVVLQCETVDTVEGFELTRLHLTSFTGDVLLDYKCQPKNKPLRNNQNELTNELKYRPYIDLAHLHQNLMTHISNQTIIVGHYLKVALMAAKIYHLRIVDTYQLHVLTKNKPSQSLSSLVHQNLGHDHPFLKDLKNLELRSRAILELVTLSLP